MQFSRESINRLQINGFDESYVSATNTEKLKVSRWAEESQVDIAGSEGVTWLITTSLRQITKKFLRL